LELNAAQTARRFFHLEKVACGAFSDVALFPPGKGATLPGCASNQ